MNPTGDDTFNKEDNMGEGYDHPYAEGELEDQGERLHRKQEKFRRRAERFNRDSWKKYNRRSGQWN